MAASSSSPPAQSSEELPRPLGYHVDANGRVHLTPQEQSAEAASEPTTQSGSPARKHTEDSLTTPRKSIVTLRWARRISQGAFLLLFLWLLTQTAFRGQLTSAPTTKISLPVEVFFLFDPLAALLTVLSTHRLHAALALSGITVAITLVFGRVFCGWVCPFGTLHHITAWLFPSRRLKGARRIRANEHRPGWHRVKYVILYVILGAALMGSAVGGLFDPIALTVRGIGLSLLPVAQHLTDNAADNVAANHTLQVASGHVRDFLATTLWQSRPFHYHVGWLLGLVFLALLALDRLIPRLWCRYFCPLGAMLGLLSKFALFGMEKEDDKCTNCNLCMLHCQGADNPRGGEPWRQEECFMCFNCEVACPADVIRFKFLPRRRERHGQESPDPGRRTILAAGAAGAVLVPAMRSSDGVEVNYNPRLIRPPGALDEESFLDRCIRCGECIKVCPSNALHPAFLEAGLEGIWTPVLIPRIGYCEHSCTLCTQVCPTGALRPLTVKDKVGTDSKPPVKLGTAFYDRGRCLPWGMETPCIVCEEFCPTSPKAIWVEEVDLPKRVVKSDGTTEMTTVHLQRPHLDPALCIGCGTCENVCPVQDEPAIRVTNIGESRSRSNVILLRDRSS